MHSSSFASAYSLHKNLPYDTLNDFAAVIPVGKTPTVLVTSPVKGFKTVADLIAAAKARPGAMNFASAGVGSVSHLAAERFRLSAGIEAQHIPFQGPNEAFTEVMAGRIDFYFLPLAPALPLVKDGQLTALAVSTDKRAGALPDVPTTTELGLKDSAYLFWTGIFVPAKTPRDIVTSCTRNRARRCRLPTVQERLAKVGNEPMPMSGRRVRQIFQGRSARDREAHAADRHQAGRLSGCRGCRSYGRKRPRWRCRRGQVWEETPRRATVVGPTVIADRSATATP